MVKNLFYEIGWWNIDSFTGSYQSRSLPYDVMRVLAGFHQDPLSYSLKRDVIEPPNELKTKLFPWVEEGFEQINQLLTSKEKESEHSGLGFLRMLDYLRKVFLQDAAAYYLDSEYGSFDVFKLELFTLPEFKKFYKKVTDTIADTSQDVLFEAGTERKLTQLLESQLSSEKRDLTILEKLDSVNEAIEKSIEKSEQKLKRSFQNAFLHASNSFSSDTAETSTLYNQCNQEEVLETQNSRENSIEEEKEIPIHKLADFSVVNSVGMVYKEWFEGWDGRPSITQLIENYGNSWRVKAEKKTFSRRKKIISELKRLMEDEGKSPDEAIQILEAKRNNVAVSTFADKLIIK